MRRWRLRYQRYGYDELWDRRRRTPSPRRAPLAEVERILRLYRERYAGFNGRHFYDLARRDHAVTLSYSFIKRALQGAGLLPKRRARGRHRPRSSPRPSRGTRRVVDPGKRAVSRRLKAQSLSSLSSRSRPSRSSNKSFSIALKWSVNFTI